jgi:hypothetical protein
VIRVRGHEAHGARWPQLLRELLLPYACGPTGVSLDKEIANPNPHRGEPVVLAQLFLRSSWNAKTIA